MERERSAGDCLLAGEEQRNRGSLSAQKAGSMHAIGSCERLYYTSVLLPPAMIDVAAHGLAAGDFYYPCSQWSNISAFTSTRIENQ